MRDSVKVSSGHLENGDPVAKPVVLDTRQGLLDAIIRKVGEI